MTDALAHSLASIEQIKMETLSAIDVVLAGAGPLSPSDAVTAKSWGKRVEMHCSNLTAVAQGHPLGVKKQLTLSKKFVLYSFEARLCAVIRSAAAKGKSISVAQVLEAAKNLTPFSPLPEAVMVHWLPKDKGGFRPIVCSGPYPSGGGRLVGRGGTVKLRS